MKYEEKIPTSYFGLFFALVVYKNLQKKKSLQANTISLMFQVQKGIYHAHVFISILTG